MDRTADGISAEVPDWSREHRPRGSWDPGKSLLAAIRCYQRHAGSSGIGSKVVRKLASIRHRFWSIVSGADIPLNCQLGGGLLIPHPNGIVINPDARIGPNCLIFQQVTIGADYVGVPTIGGHVDIGAGAKVLGPIHVADHAAIGANAVVLCDVPRASAAVGVPARILKPQT